MGRKSGGGREGEGRGRRGREREKEKGMEQGILAQIFACQTSAANFNNCRTVLYIYNFLENLPSKCS